MFFCGIWSEEECNVSVAGAVDDTEQKMVAKRVKTNIDFVRVGSEQHVNAMLYQLKSSSVECANRHATFVLALIMFNY